MGNEAGEPDTVVTPRWRRVLEVLGVVAAVGIVVPLTVNGLASAINSAAESDPPTTTIAPPTTTIAPPASVTATSVTPAPTDVTTTATAVTIPGVDRNADEQTVALAAEIVGEVAATATTALPSPTTSASVPTNVSVPTNGSVPASSGGHSHGATHTELPLTRQERADLGAQLAEARATAEQYPTVADALAAGYVKVTGYVPLIGAHYVKWALMDGTFDVTQPEMLLYDGTDPASSIVGLSYYMFTDTEPSPFVGPNDIWHQHIGLCLRDGVVVGGESTTPEECAARGGQKAGAENGWMVHAWVVPGWESPQGVFSPEHVGLTAELPTS